MGKQSKPTIIAIIDEFDLYRCPGGQSIDKKETTELSFYLYDNLVDMYDYFHYTDLILMSDGTFGYFHESNFG